jgi:hypothetical protein
MRIIQIHIRIPKYDHCNADPDPAFRLNVDPDPGAGQTVGQLPGTCPFNTTHKSRVTDPHHYNADPVPAFRLNVDPDTAFHFNAEPDQGLLFKVMRICDHWPT